MFRDRDEELERLNRQLLEEAEEDEEEYKEEYEEEYEEDDEDEYQEEAEPQPDYNAYNADSTDVDLEDFCRQLDEPSRRSGLRFVAIFFLLAAVILLTLALLLAHQRGFL